MDLSLATSNYDMSDIKTTTEKDCLKETSRNTTEDNNNDSVYSTFRP